MALMSVTVDPLVVERIAKSLEELVVLVRAKLLADGYLRPPQDPKPSTASDVRIIDGRSVWREQLEEQKAQKRQEQGIEGEWVITDIRI